MSEKRIELHNAERAAVAHRLLTLCLDVEAAAPAPHCSFDFTVTRAVRVTLRVASRTVRKHRVTINGRRYEYLYPTWHFNFHHHGRVGERYTDFFVCVAVGGETYVIPWESVGGKTFPLHDGKKPYRGKYARFCGDFEAIAEASRAAVAGDTRRRGAA